jgi:hypothetical protein
MYFSSQMSDQKSLKLIVVQLHAVVMGSIAGGGAEQHAVRSI